VRGELHILEADDGEVLWDPQPESTGSLDGAEGDQVVDADHGCRSQRRLQQRACGPVTAGDRVLGLGDQPLPGGDAPESHSAIVAEAPLVDLSALPERADEGDAPVPLAEKMLRRVKSALLLVGDHAGKLRGAAQLLEEHDRTTRLR
jgi:hypothetical protein